MYPTRPLATASQTPVQRALRPAFLRARAYLRQSLAAFPFVVSAPEVVDLDRRMALANLLRLRVIAVMLLLTQPLLAVVDWQTMDVFQLSPQPSLWAGWGVIGLRAALILASALLLGFYARVWSPEQVTDGRRTGQCFFMLFCLLVAALWTGLRWPVSITAYLLAAFAGAAFAFVPLAPGVLTYGLAWLTLMAVLVQPQPMPEAVMPNAINGTILSVLAFVVSRVTYANQVRAFRNEHLIEQQRRQLEEANRQLAASNAALERLSFCDQLTGVPNRRALEQTLQREWGRARREGLPLALLILDVDYFKQFNDTYGHPAGDECLARIAKVVQETLNRPVDLLARIGGDEFVAVLPNTDVAGALCVGERVCLAMAALGVPHAGSPRGVVTLSLGIACRVPAQGEEPETIMAAADAALYRAKAAGRDRCECAS